MDLRRGGSGAIAGGADRVLSPRPPRRASRSDRGSALRVTPKVFGLWFLVFDLFLVLSS
jgi:hypothetical protein